MTVFFRIKSVFRNKRFIIFTLIFPSIWYILFVYKFSDFIKLDTNMFAIYSAMFGVAGAGLNTFSMKVSKEKEYYNLISNTSNYSIVRFVFDSMISQTMLNILIICVITLIGLFINKIHINIEYIRNIVMLLYYGLYYILLGLLLGIKLNDEALAAASMPLYFMFMFINLTPNAVSFKGFEFLTFIQKIFPGYYFNEFLNLNVYNNAAWDVTVIFIHLILASLLAIIAFKGRERCN